MMNEEKNENKKLPPGIHLLENGLYRLYITRNGKPYQPTVTWRLLLELGVPVSKTTRLTNPGLELAKTARIKLQAKIVDEVRTGVVEANASPKTWIKDLFPLVVQDYRQKGRKSLDHEKARWEKNVKPFFGNLIASALSTDDINRYIDMRTREGAGDGTINRELALVRRAFTLGHRTKPPKVTNIPYFPRLAEPKARQGFLSDETYDKLARECSAEGIWLRGMFAIGGNFGWRKSEVLGLRVRQLDFPGRAIRLDPGTTKNDEARTVRMPADVYELLSACASGKKDNHYVFTRENGERIRDFRTAWSNVCERAGCPGLLFHDLRRTGARNLRRLGIAEGTIMKIGGWKTRAIFERYNIIDESDLEHAAARLDEKRAQRAAIETDKKIEQARFGTATKTATDRETPAESGRMLQ